MAVVCASAWTVLVAAERTILNESPIRASAASAGRCSQQPVADDGQQPIADQMAVQVVERLETVDVKFDQGAAASPRRPTGRPE